MDKIRFAMMGLSAVATILCFVGDAPSVGGQGWFLIALCAVPGIFGGLATAKGAGLTRGQSIGSALCFLLAAMKSQEAFQNVMMAAFFGMIMCVILAVKPETTQTDDPSEATTTVMDTND